MADLDRMVFAQWSNLVGDQREVPQRWEETRERLRDCFSAYDRLHPGRNENGIFFVYCRERGRIVCVVGGRPLVFACLNHFFERIFRPSGRRNLHQQSK